MYLGVDVGKQGGFVLITDDGRPYLTWEMPLIANEPSAQAIANLYHEIREICGDKKPFVAIEKIFTKPTDGRVGQMNYAQGAGRLEMCAIFGWPMLLVHPFSWTKEMHRGLSKEISAKERSMKVFSMLYPEMYRKGSMFWQHEKRAKPHDGLIDALLIAEYARRLHK